MDLKKSIQLINKRGSLLVFPIKNKKLPKSLWSELHPRTEMKWDWNEDGSDKVFKMWQRMKTLSATPDVIYSKWYQGRATFFSKELFKALLCHSFHQPPVILTSTAKEIKELLEGDSPLSTKQIKALTNLKGKYLEPNYNRAMKELFQNFLVVAYGEVDDGAFPSLAVGATQLLFEDLWHEAQAMDINLAKETIEKFLPQGQLMRKYYEKTISARLKHN